MSDIYQITLITQTGEWLHFTPADVKRVQLRQPQSALFCAHYKVHLRVDLMMLKADSCTNRNTSNS